MSYHLFLQYLAVLLINATAAGCTFGWFALEGSAINNGWNSAKLMPTAYVAGLLSFTIGGLLMALLLIKRMEASLGILYAFLVMFVGELMGILCIIVGVQIVPPLIVLGQVILNFFCVGSYTLSYRLEDKLPRARIPVAIGFAISTLVYQVVQIPIAPEISLSCWLIIHGVAAGFFLLIMWRVEIDQMAPSDLCKQIKLIVRRKIVWICGVLVFIVILNQSYYFQTFNRRINVFTQDEQNTLIVILSATQAISSLAGLIMALPLVVDAVISTILISISGLSLCAPFTFISMAIMMAPMTLGATGAISAVMGILYLNTRCVEATFLCYSGMILGNTVGYVLSILYTIFPWVDCLVGAITPFSALCAAILIPLQYLSKNRQLFTDDGEHDVKDLFDDKNKNKGENKKDDSPSISVDRPLQP